MSVQTKRLFIIGILYGLCLNAQEPTSFKAREYSFLSKMSEGDSLIYYQCHVESAEQKIYTASGQTLSSSTKSISITEKYVLKKNDQGFELKYYNSPLTIMPNRRFSGLKFGEKAYWEFKLVDSKNVNDTQLKILQAIENQGREATEYDFAITRYNTNQLILLHGKDTKQLGLNDGLLISRLFSYTKN